MQGIKNKVAIVTGGATMIGEAVVAALVKAGARVVVADIDQEQGQKVAEQWGEQARFIATDVTQDAAVQQCVAATMVTNRTAEQWWSGKVMSSQFIFGRGLEIERELGMNQWEADCPKTEGIGFSIPTPDGSGQQALHWHARLQQPGQSVDQRLKYPGWMAEFEHRGGELLIEDVDLAGLERLAASHELVLLAGGKGEIVNLLQRDESRSPMQQPMRQLALTYVTGMRRHDYFECVNFNLIPGVGEYFVFPALTTQGAHGTQSCDIMVFEGVPGGPMDCWGEARTPEQHLETSLHILKTYLPWEYERSRDCQLSDANGILAGRVAPTVRHPVLSLPSGRKVMGLGDAVVVNDPITGQGSNNATRSAYHDYQAILARGALPYDEAWMEQTFENLYETYVGAVVRWTNSMLLPPPEFRVQLLGAAQELPALASRLANGFNDPRDYANYWFDAQGAQQAMAQAQALRAA